jgi:hypothetical protein
MEEGGEKQKGNRKKEREIAVGKEGFPGVAEIYEIRNKKGKVYINLSDT